MLFYAELMLQDKKRLSAKRTAKRLIKEQDGLILVSAEVSAGTSLLLAGFAKIRATLGFVLQTFFLIKSLFAFCEYEFLAAIFAD
jgi:hypothetical protein